MGELKKNLRMTSTTIKTVIMMVSRADSTTVILLVGVITLDRPLPVQYALWLGRVVRGDLGYSMINRRPVGEMVGERIWSTLQLTIAALILSILVGIPLGILSAVKQYSVLDYLTTLFSFAAVSVPGFFLSLGLIYIFALQLKWLPTSGMRLTGLPHWGQATLTASIHGRCGVCPSKASHPDMARAASSSRLPITSK